MALLGNIRPASPAQPPTWAHPGSAMFEASVHDPGSGTAAPSSKGAAALHALLSPAALPQALQPHQNLQVGREGAHQQGAQEGGGQHDDAPGARCGDGLLETSGASTVDDEVEGPRLSTGRASALGGAARHERPVHVASKGPFTLKGVAQEVELLRCSYLAAL
jgi:hypothetical protein